MEIVHYSEKEELQL